LATAEIDVRKATLIYNPLAGTLHLDPVIDVVAEFWREHGWEVQIQPTRYAGHARSLARKAVESGNELVLAAGGDGTLGEIAGGLADSETVMAPLPAGTGNSFTRELMLAKPGFLRRRTLLDACAKLIEGQVQHIDLGCYNGDERWLLWAGAGVDSFVIAHIEPRSRFARRLGGIGYLGLGTPFLSRFPGVEATVTVDGSTFQDNYLMVIVSNCRRYAGGKFLLSPDASLDDGLLEVWMFKGRVGWGIYRYLAFMAIGRHLNHPDTLMVKGRDITIETQPLIPFQRDGDPAGSTPMRCWVKPESLRLLVPQEVSPTLFTKPGVIFDR
jgi:YegS/Rv2252/BmrU family lipid kinase